MLGVEEVSLYAPVYADQCAPHVRDATSVFMREFSQDLGTPISKARRRHNCRRGTHGCACATMIPTFYEPLLVRHEFNL
jgi:hypothetical protein